MQYSSNVEQCQAKETSIRKAYMEKRSKVQKLQVLVKTAQKNSLLATNALKKKKSALLVAKSGSGPKKEGDSGDVSTSQNRYDDTMLIMRKAADMRREEVNKKKMPTFSATFVESHPELPEPLKKGLLHIMHRRKYHIVLRPMEEDLLSELRSSITTSLKQMEAGEVSIDDELLKAEQLFLLSSHPTASGLLPSVPPSKNNEPWAEPGWQLVLNVPKTSNSHSSLLPCGPTYPVLQKMSTEFASTPGRQASNLLGVGNLRSFTTPLSKLSSLTSLGSAMNAKDNLGEFVFVRVCVWVVLCLVEFVSL
jgi:hypothetical protein